jgi:glycosyltransferase involved in cell wall biosynthesis
MKNNIKVITPFYNPAKFLLKNVRVSLNQKYSDYKVIFVDDCSTDGSWDKIPHTDERVISIKNQTRKTALENIHDAIMNHCDPDDIVVLMDGDDWFPTRNVLAEVNDFYNKTGCWVSYGQAQWTSGIKGFARPYTFDEFHNLRSSPFVVSHLRTFRAGLYQGIANQDPEFRCLKDENGDFYKMTYDVAIMLPLMEMAGFQKVKYNDNVWYIYNRDNPISDDKVNQKLQWDIHRQINEKEPFKLIEHYNEPRKEL